jgi:hypothetical protein
MKRRMGALFRAASLALALAGCAVTPAASPGTTGVPGAPSIGPGVAAARGALEAALAPAGFSLELVPIPDRPPEPAGFAPLARVTLRAPLAADPAGGRITLYEFADAPAATAAGSSLAAYLGSGPTRVQFTPDARFVLRQVGSTIVFFAWSPSNAPDARTGDLAAAVATVGREIPVRPL